MARYDEHTKAFMDKVANKEEAPAPQEDISLKPLKMVRSVLKGVSNPQKALGKLLVRSVIDNAMEKAGSMKILSLYAFLNDHYDREWWDWEPETIWQTIEEDHLAKDSTPDELKNAIMALQVVLNTFAPFEHWHIFEKTVHAFNYLPVIFDTLQPAELDDIALAMAALKAIRPQTAYDSEVLIYIATCAKISGMVYLPETLYPGVQPHLDGITFEYGLRDATKASWEGSQESSAEDVALQLGKLKEIQDYVAERL